MYMLSTVVKIQYFTSSRECLFHATPKPWDTISYKGNSYFIRWYSLGHLLIFQTVHWPVQKAFLQGIPGEFGGRSGLNGLLSITPAKEFGNCLIGDIHIYVIFTFVLSPLLLSRRNTPFSVQSKPNLSITSDHFAFSKSSKKRSLVMSAVVIFVRMWVTGTSLGLVFITRGLFIPSFVITM